jgi:hypothetical protein
MMPANKVLVTRGWLFGMVFLYRYDPMGYSIFGAEYTEVRP